MELLHHEKREFSQGQEIGTLVLLSVLTYGFYTIYWFYRNWKDIQHAHNRQLHPVLRTVGLFIPLLNIFLVAQQFKHRRALGKESGGTAYFAWIWTTIGFLVLGYTYSFYTVTAIMSSLSETPDKLTLLGMAIIDLITFGLLGLLLAAAQRVLNEYWKKMEGHLATRHSLTAGEITWLVFGGMLWLLGIIEIFVS